MLINVSRTKGWLLPIISCVVLGFLVSVLFRFEVTFTSDFSFYSIGSIIHTPGRQTDYSSFYAKPLMALSGFPFQASSGCHLYSYDDGVRFRPYALHCMDSSVGELSILFNALFWGLIFFSIWVIHVRRKTPQSTISKLK